MRLEGKVAQITGGTSGIGSATAVRLSGEGAAVAITGRNAERGEQVVQDIVENGGHKAVFSAFLVAGANPPAPIITDHCASD